MTIPPPPRPSSVIERSDFSGSTNFHTNDPWLSALSYQASDEAEAIRLNSRYARFAEERLEIDINGGRADQHHSAYPGLNDYLCHEGPKVITSAIHHGLESDGERLYHGWDIRHRPPGHFLGKPPSPLRDQIAICHSRTSCHAPHQRHP